MPRFASFFACCLALGALALPALPAAAAALQPGTEVPPTHIVQWSTGDSGAAREQITYLPNPVVSGNLILAFAHWDDQHVTAALSDQKGNTYEPLGPPLNVGANERFQVWIAQNVRGGAALHVTIAFSAVPTSYSVLDVMEFGGLDRKHPLAASITATGMGDTQSSGPLAFDDPAVDCVVGLFGYESHALPYSPGEGFTFRQYEATTFVEDRSVAAPGPVTATAKSHNATNWAAFALAFRRAP